jgi:LCP family protein required for cell wall assembly
MFKKRSVNKPISSEPPHPSDQSVALEEASPFPGIGMTIASYNQDVFTAMKSAKPEKVSFWRRLWSKRSLKRVALVLIICLLLVGGWLGFKFIYNSTKIFGGSVLDVFNSTKLKGEKNGRVNILLAGNSADDLGHDGAELTDSIMIVSIDTRKNEAFMMSVPRDLWVDIPGHGHHKINEAYVDGERDKFSESGYAQGGMGLLQKVIAKNFDIPLHYYALINYNAFRDTVNAVGGVDVVIDSSDRRGLYDSNFLAREGGPLKLSNGPHHLDGDLALKLARARGDGARTYGFPASDHDRTKHQRQLLLALKEKAFSTGVLVNPVRLSSLMDALGNNVKTDLKLSEVKRLVEIGQKVSDSKIASIGLNDANGKNLLKSYRSSSGQAALIPAAGMDDFSEIRNYLRQLMSSDPIAREGASVTVLNGTEVHGLAAKASRLLTSKNIMMDDLADAPNRPETLIINNSGGSKPATLGLLKKTFGSNSEVTNNSPAFADRYDSDFVVVLGADQIAALTKNN